MFDVGLPDIRSVGLERLEKSNHGLRGQVLVEIVVDLDHGGVDAGSEALDFNHSEESVFGGLARVDTEVVLDGLDDLVTSATSQLTWSLSLSVPRSIKEHGTYGSADLDVKLADWGTVVHGIESSNFVHAHGWHLQ